MATPITKEIRIAKSPIIQQEIHHMNATVQHKIEKIDRDHDSITKLTKVLEKIIQELELEAPQSISILFDGTEVYRY